jgi:hypothetical protein
MEDEEMKLSQLTQSDKIKLAAELDGWLYFDDPKDNLKCASGVHQWFSTNHGCCSPTCFDNYATSYDAIIPLIQKQDDETKQQFFYALATMRGHRIEETAPFAISLRITHLEFSKMIVDNTPSQLLDALLVATGKAEL